MSQYDTAWSSIPWQWTKGASIVHVAKEVRDIADLNQYDVSTKSAKLADRKSIDLRASTIAENNNPVPKSLDNRSDVGGKFAGQVPGGYAGAFFETFEFQIPSIWSIFNDDFCHVTFDVAIQFGLESWQPDNRSLDAWVWDVDVGKVLIDTFPLHTSFRYVDNGIYRALLKVAGRFSKAGTIRFGFNISGFWNSGQYENTIWFSTVNAHLSAITTSLYAWINNKEEDFSEESSPSSMTLVPSPEPFVLLEAAVDDDDTTPD